jgi:hypothetical protein
MMISGYSEEQGIDDATGLPLADLAPGPPVPTSNVTRLPAGQTLLMAARVEAEAAKSDPEPAEAARQRAREAVEQVRAPVEQVTAIGGELVPMGDTPAGLALRDTLELPDAIAADASRMRLEPAHQAGVLETAVDAADTMEAGNSFEKMLTHPTAAVGCMVARARGRARLRA